MRNLIARVIILVATAAALGLHVNAQSGQQYRAQVPFDFTAAGRSYTAGNYSIGQLSAANDAGAISLLDRKTGKMRIIGMSRGRSEGDTGKLVFAKNGTHYELIGVSTPSFRLKMNQPKREVARETSEIIELALK